MAIESGIPQKRIKLTKIVENTEQEFLEIRNNITDDDVIGLITSAFHMQRALMHMYKITNEVVIIPVDYRSTSKQFTFLGLETSCDVTAAAVIRENDNVSTDILSYIVSSQIVKHKKFC